MTPRSFLPALIPAVLVAVLVVVAACGGGDDVTEFQPGQLTDPQNVPTATPWPDPPEVIIIDPDSLTPIGSDEPIVDNGDNDGATPPPGEPGVCGDTYTIEVGDTLFAIAERCGVSLDDIRALNPDADPAALSPGQVIQLPPVSPGTDE